MTSCLQKNNRGANTPQEACFLLWYHCNTAEDKKLEELSTSDVPLACLVGLLGRNGTSADQSCCAGLLSAFTNHESCREPAARTKTGGQPCLTILTNALNADGEGIRTYASKALANISSLPEVQRGLPSST